MVRQETERAIREEIAYLNERRDTLIGKRRRLDEQIVDVDAEIKKLEDFLGPTTSHRNSKRSRSMSGTATPDLVYDLLVETGQPLHFRTIYERLRHRDPRPPQSKDPANALLARYYNDSRFYRTAPGTYALRNQTGPEKHRNPTSQKRRPPTGYSLLGVHYSSLTFKDILLDVCETLYDLDPEGFRQVLAASPTQGFFSEDHRERESGGELRRPRAIGNSGIFAETHLNAKSLEYRCRAVLGVLGLDESDFAIETG